MHSHKKFQQHNVVLTFNMPMSLFSSYAVHSFFFTISCIYIIAHQKLISFTNSFEKVKVKKLINDK